MIPIVLVTGFLGSGKTTFINWLLEKHPDLKISVILNEFGNTPLESQFVKQHADNIVELANGCMCCVAKSDIPRVVSYILEHSPQTEYMLIEASGLSDPDPVREALQTPPVNTHTYLESTICVIDAVHFEEMRTQNAIITSQIADADLVILSKIEEAGPEKTQRVQLMLENLTPDVHVIQFTSDLAPEIFLTRTQPSTSKKPGEDHEPHHTHEEYQIIWYESEQKFNYDKLHDFLAQLPKSVIRIKGIVHCVTEKGDTFVVRIQRVGAHLNAEELKPDEKTLEKTTLLFIGKEIDENSLKQNVEKIRLP